MWKKFKRSVINGIGKLPGVRADLTTTVNGECDTAINGNMELRHATRKEVKACWRAAQAPGWTSSPTKAHKIFLQELLPVCIDLRVYSQMFKDALTDPELYNVSAITQEHKISASVQSMISSWMKNYMTKHSGVYLDPQLLISTEGAISNQVVIRSIHRVLSAPAGNVGELIFRTGGRPRKARHKAPPISAGPKPVRKRR
jgi:hypothetical protein